MAGSQNIRILFVGGGSGGHFYPLMGIAEALNGMPETPKLYYAGPNEHDPQTLAELGITFVSIPSGKQRKYQSFKNFLDLFKVMYGFCVALWKLYVIYPDVIMSKGGYTSIPVILAGTFFRIPIIIHESDSVIGRANKFALSHARHVVINYPELKNTLKHPRVHALGIPIRHSLLMQPSSDAFTKLHIDTQRPVLLVLGGSQGAKRINELILDSLDDLLSDFSIIHQTGDLHFELCKLSAQNLIPDEARRMHYHPYPFLSAPLLNDAYHVSSIVISRAGSTSIYEISLHGKPSIIIPIPENVSHDQRTNAYAYARVSGATVMEEGNLTDGLLRAEIDRIMQNNQVYEKMVEGAKSFGRVGVAEQMSTLILETGKQH